MGWRLSRNYLYCSPCSGPVGLFPLCGEQPVEARPWVEVLGHNVPHNPQHLPIRQDSATFQRLGMRSGSGKADPPVPVLPAAQLETRPMSMQRALVVGAGQRNKIISPTSAEVMARRDTGLQRAQLNRLSSRRTLQFMSPVEVSQDQPRQVRSSRRQGEGGEGTTSRSEDGSGQTVIRVNRKPSNNKENQNMTEPFDNPAYESASVDDRSTIIMSPPQIRVSPPRQFFNRPGL